MFKLEKRITLHTVAELLDFIEKHQIPPETTLGWGCWSESLGKEDVSIELFVDSETNQKRIDFTDG